jgi:hypothetical protein
MWTRRLILVSVATLSLAATAFADGAKRRGESSGGSSSNGAEARQPSGGGGSSSGGSSSGGSWGGGSEARSNGGSQSDSPRSEDRSPSVSRTDAERRQPRPRQWDRNSIRYGRNWPYRDRHVNAYYPYWGNYDGYYYGYYGWRSPYWPHYGVTYNDNDFGSVRLLVNPEEAEVFVDGYFAGMVNDYNGLFQRLQIRPGRHEITLKCEGYRTHRVKVYVPYAQTLKIRFDMKTGNADEISEQEIGIPMDDKRAPAADDDTDAEDIENGMGLLRLVVRPDDASVYVDGEARGAARSVSDLDLPVGMHLIEVVRPGFSTYEREVNIKNAEPKTIEIELEKLRVDRP